MSIGVIQAINTSGRFPSIKIEDKWYNVSNDVSLTGFAANKSIEYEAKSSNYEDKKTGELKTSWWINKAALLTTSTATQPPAVETQTAPRTGPFVAPEHLPFVSNTVAHAIAAGCIKEPADIVNWVYKARQAIIGEEIPF